MHAYIINMNTIVFLNSIDHVQPFACRYGLLQMSNVPQSSSKELLSLLCTTGHPTLLIGLNNRCWANCCPNLGLYVWHQSFDFWYTINTSHCIGNHVLHPCAIKIIYLHSSKLNVATFALPVNFCTQFPRYQRPCVRLNFEYIVCYKSNMCTWIQSGSAC